MRQNIRNIWTGPSLVIASTAVAGIGGYAITFIMARGLGPSFAVFATFWSILFLAIGSISGIQQEVTRGTSRSPEMKSNNGKAKLGNFALSISGVMLVFSILLLIPVSPVLFKDDPVGMSFPLVFGATVSVFVATISGGLYGTHSWKPLSILIVGDVLIRLCLLAVGVVSGMSLISLAWLTVAPFLLVIVLVYPLARKSIGISSTLDIGYIKAFKNVFRTFLAAIGSAILVSGFPALIMFGNTTITNNELASLIFALTVTRAPLIVGMLALQSMLVVKFRDQISPLRSSVLKMFLYLSFAAVLLAVCSFAFGSQLILIIAGPGFFISPLFLGGLTLLSLPTALLVIAGAATLSRSLHNTYTSGWIVAAVFSASIMLLPIYTELKLCIALALGPLLGVSIHLTALAIRRRTF